MNYGGIKSEWSWEIFVSKVYLEASGIWTPGDIIFYYGHLLKVSSFPFPLREFHLSLNKISV